MPLLPLDKITAIVCFTACPLLKYRNFKDYKTQSAARLITRTKNSEHINPVLFNLHWLSLEHRVIFKLLLFIHKAAHALTSDYLANLLTFYNPVRTLRSSRSMNLSVPRSRTYTYGDRSFACVSTRL